MIASIIARKYGDGNLLKLSVRLSTPEMKTAIALNISVTNAKWTIINETLKVLSKASNNGSAILIEDPLAAKLWQLVKTMDTLYTSDHLNKETAKEAVYEAFRQDVIKERERKIEAPKKAAEKPRMTLKEWIAEFIRQYENGERLKRRSTKPISANTVKSYKGTLSQLEAYEKESHKVIDFDDVTMDFYDDWKAFFIKKMYSPNTIGKHVKNLKTFLFAAEDMKLTTKTDFKSSRFVVDREDVDNVYLTEERIQELYDFNPMDTGQLAACIEKLPKKDRQRMKELTERESSRKAFDVCKDVFVVGCLTGQRVSDYKRVNDDMIVKLRDGREYISLRQEKTGKDIYIPLDPRVTVLLNKYGGALPKVYDQKINKRIKIVGHLLGWTEDAEVSEHHGNMTVDNGKKFYECIKTHTARRTFATNAYKNGISLSSIMAVTGHSSEAMLRKYLKLDNEERAILAAEEFTKAKRVTLKVAQ